MLTSDLVDSCRLSNVVTSYEPNYVVIIKSFPRDGTSNVCKEERYIFGAVFIIFFQIQHS